MKLLIPDAIYPRVLDVDLADLRRRGIAGLLVDIGSTIVPWVDPQIAQALVEWIRRA